MRTLMGIHKEVFPLIIFLLFTTFKDGSTAFEIQGKDGSSEGKTLLYQNSYKLKGYLNPLEEDKPDAPLPSLEEQINEAELLENTNGISPDQMKHRILSKRQVQNDYERFYLCLFSLFTNPQCNDNANNNLNRQSTDFYSGNNNNYNAFPSSTTNNGNNNNRYVPLFQPLFQRPVGNGGGLFGLGQGGGFGLFNNRFQNPNNNYYNGINNYNPYQSQAPQIVTLHPILSTTTTTTASPISNFYPNQFSQNPYPEPQVNRRPRPESLEKKNLLPSFTTTPTTTAVPSTMTTTTPIASTTTTTTSTTPRLAPSTTPLSLRLPFNPSIAVEDPGASIFNSQEDSIFFQEEEKKGTKGGVDSKTEADTLVIESATSNNIDCDPIEDQSNQQSSASPAAATFPILGFEGIQSASSTTPLSSEFSSEENPSKYPNKDPDYFKLKAKIQELERNVNFFKRENSNLLKRSSEIRKENDEIRKDFEDLKRENLALKSYEGATQEQVLSYQVQTKYLQDALITLKEDGRKLKQRINQLERTNNHLQQTNGQLQHSNGDHKTQLNEFKSKLKYLEEKVIRLSAENYHRNMLEQKELKDKISKLGSEYSQCKQQIYEIQLKQTNKFISSGNSFDKRVGVADQKIDQNTKQIVQIEIEKSQEDDEMITTTTSEDPLTIFKIESESNSTAASSTDSGENSTEISSSEIYTNDGYFTIIPMINSTEILNSEEPETQLNSSSLEQFPTVPSTLGLNFSTKGGMISPENVAFEVPVGIDFSEFVPRKDANDLPLEGEGLNNNANPDFDVRIGGFGSDGNGGSINLGHESQGAMINYDGNPDDQQVYGQYPLYNLDQGHGGGAQSGGAAHDNPFRIPFYPGVFSNLRQDSGFGQIPEYYRRSL